MPSVRRTHALSVHSYTNSRATLIPVTSPADKTSAMDLSIAHQRNIWALVLAVGEGRRLQGLTRNVQGVAVPKQFCSLQGGASLLEEALQRAAAVAQTDRICTVVAAQHRQWWTGINGRLPPDNVIVQPQNRGTAHGILLPLLNIASRDPDAIIVLLPADHHIQDDQAMTASLRQAADLAGEHRGSIYLLGAEPEGPDPELGYIVPASRSGHEPATVLRFIEKPTAARARALLDQGALWNMFIVAASVQALLGLFGCSFASTIAAMRILRGSSFDDMYQQLRSIDFSRDLLHGNESKLKVLPVPNCGWSDLGTPQRIALTLRHLDYEGTERIPVSAPDGCLNLAHQYMRLSGHHPCA
jgi:mannose-1-phosphate guanylyltransferase